MIDEKPPFNPPRISRVPIATLRINPRYLPLTRDTSERFAMLLSTIGCELLKGEHATSRTFVLSLPVEPLTHRV